MFIMKKSILKTLSVLMVLVTLFSTYSVFAFAQAENYSLIVTDTIPANTGVDVSDALQQLIDDNPNRTIYFPDGEYLLSKPLKTPADPKKSVSLRLADYAVIKAIGDWTYGEALIQLGGKDPYNTTRVNGSNYALEGGIIDGSNMANGISINSGRETAVRNCSIKNTVVGLHIMYGANSGSSDSDIFGVNIIGTGNTDSVGMLVEGFDNTITNSRIGNVFIGVHVKSGGNMLRNIHPLYTSDYTDFLNSCGFLLECGDNWLDYCYSDQFGIGFRITGNHRVTLHDCFCYWYSPNGGTHTAIKADQQFEAAVTNFRAGFQKETDENKMLSVGKIGGTGTITNLSVASDRVKDHSYKAYVTDNTFIERVFGFLLLLFSFIK